MEHFLKFWKRNITLIVLDANRAVGKLGPMINLSMLKMRTEQSNHTTVNVSWVLDSSVLYARNQFLLPRMAEFLLSNILFLNESSCAYGTWKTHTDAATAANDSSHKILHLLI
jgi:hypothetical protein